MPRKRRDPGELRKAAEKKAADETSSGVDAAPTLVEARRLIHELRVHQIELEMQNEELRRVQMELASSKARYFDLFDLAPVGYMTVSKKGMILESNLTAAHLLGTNRSELVKKPFTQFVLAEDQDIYYRHRKMLFETGIPKVCELRLLHAGGPPLWIRLQGAVALDGEIGEHVSRVILSDINAHKQAEAALCAKTDEFERFFSNALDLFCIADTNGFFRRLNKQWETTLGYTLADLENRRFLDFVHPDDMDSTLHAVARLDAQEEILHFTNRYRHKDGSYRVIEWRSSPYGKSIFAAARDVTDRNKADEEKSRLTDQLQQAMKMEAVGRLAGGVAHDFNNLLTGITGNVALALMDLNPADPLYAMLAEVEKAAGSAAALTKQLLAFSRKQILEPRVINLSEVVANLSKMLVRIIGEDIELAISTADNLWAVKMDPGQLEQVLVNLAVNARDAMPDGGKLAIETMNRALDPEYCRTHVDARPGRYVMLTVKDTGTGMSQEVKSHLFEPFFTTKPMGRGTGLGLATIYGAVKQADGIIEVDSESDVGTTFRIYLPMIEDKPESIGKAAGAPDLIGGDETILVVEDEPVLRNIAVKMTRRLGYKVLSAPDGKSALALAKGFDSRIDLLLTDVIMPGMNGRQLSESLQGTHPEIAVLFMSGYTDDILMEHGINKGNFDYIAKPYTPQKLSMKIREVLDRK